MDDTLVRTALDLSARPFLYFDVDMPTDKIGSFDTELVREFFQAISTHAGITLHIEKLHGYNSHHIAEAAFKSFAKSLRFAIEKDTRNATALHTTKGALWKMLTAIVDYSSGNLHSARKAFEKISASNNLGSVVVTSNPDVISSADRLVLPGDGAFPACKT